MLNKKNEIYCFISKRRYQESEFYNLLNQEIVCKNLKFMLIKFNKSILNKDEAGNIGL